MSVQFQAGGYNASLGPGSPSPYRATTGLMLFAGICISVSESCISNNAKSNNLHFVVALAVKNYTHESAYG
jgi:hypothetical protein